MTKNPKIEENSKIARVLGLWEENLDLDRFFFHFCRSVKSFVFSVKFSNRSKSRLSSQKSKKTKKIKKQSKKRRKSINPKISKKIQKSKKIQNNAKDEENSKKIQKSKKMNPQIEDN